jgi:hypothetical protein
MALDLQKVAKVLDAAADHWDALDAEKVHSVKAEKNAQIDALASKYAAATGEELSDEMRAKLAGADGDVVTLLRHLTEKNAGSVDTLGGPSEKDDDKPAPTSVKEAADAAYDRFGNWVTS